MILLRQIMLNNPLLQTHLKLMRFFGLVVFEEQHCHFLHSLKGLFAIVVWNALIITQIIDLIEQFGDFLKMTTNLSFTLIISITVGQCYQFLYYRSDLVTTVFNEIDLHINKIPSYFTGSDIHRENVAKIVSRNVRKVKIMVTMYVTSSFVCVQLMVFLLYWKYLQAGGLSVEERENIDLLAIRTWYPVDIYENFLPWIYIHQAIISYIGIWLVPLVQTLIVAFMVHASIMLQVLKYRCKTITDGIEDGRSLDERDLIIIQKLRDIVETQLELVRFVRNLDNLFRSSMFITFLVFSVLLCSLLFQLSMMGLGADLIVPILFISNMIIIMLMFCWHSNEIAYHSSTLPNSIYLCDWHQCSNKVKYLVLIFMIGSQRPMTLSAVYFKMTLETYLNILKASYSYFTLLSGISEHN